MSDRYLQMDFMDAVMSGDASKVRHFIIVKGVDATDEGRHLPLKHTLDRMRYFAHKIETTGHGYEDFKRFRKVYECLVQDGGVDPSAWEVTLSPVMLPQRHSKPLQPPPPPPPLSLDDPSSTTTTPRPAGTLAPARSAISRALRYVADVLAPPE